MTSSTPAPTWRLGTRIAFRFFFVYVGLYLAPFPLLKLSPIGETPDFITRAASAIATWVANHLLGRPEQFTAPPPKPRPPGKIEPISEELCVLRITVGREFAEDLARARAAFGQPSGGLEQVIHHCLRVALTQHERRRRGTGRPQRVESRAEGRYIPAAVRDGVWRRDEGRCAFVGSGGVRCGATEPLHFHHHVAHARGGEATIENISLRCPAHNRFHAEQDFGRDHVARAIENASRA